MCVGELTVLKSQANESAFAYPPHIAAALVVNTSPELQAS
jgi:hypothetical protein